MDKNFSRTLWPAIFLMVTLSLSSLFFGHAQWHILRKFSPMVIPSMQMLTIIPNIVGIIFLLIGSIYLPFEKLFRYAIYLLFIVLLGSSILVLFKSPLPHEEGFHTLGSLQIPKVLLINWHYTLFYLTAAMMGLKVSLLFVWGFINRLSELDVSLRYFLPLSFFLQIILSVLSIIIAGFEVSHWPFIDSAFPALGFLALSLPIFQWSWKRLISSETPMEEPKEEKSFPYISAAYLTAGIMIVLGVLLFTVQSEARVLFPKPDEYRQFMNRYSFSLGLSTIGFMFVWLFLGMFLLRKKGWAYLAKFGALSLFIAGIILLALTTFPVLPLWQTQGIFRGLLVGSASLLFFTLVQILYVNLRKERRFRAKVITEMVAVPIIQSIGSLIPQALIIFGISTVGMLVPMSIFSLFLLFLLYFAAKRTGSFLQGSLPQS